MYFRNYKLGNKWLCNRLRSPISENKQDSRHIKGSQTQFESSWQQFFNIFSALLENLGSKKSLLVLSKILVLFVHRLTVDDKYPLCNKQNLQQPIQTELCNIEKLLSQLSPTSVKFIFNFQYFEKKDKPYGACFSEIIDCELRRYLII